MMDWIPVVLVTFKVLVLGIGMFFAVKWHYDRGSRDRAGRVALSRRALLRAGGKVAASFVLSLLVVGLLTFVLARMLDLDLRFH